MTATGPADFLMYFDGTTYFAKARVLSGYTDVSGSDCATVFASARDQMKGPIGGTTTLNGAITNSAVTALLTSGTFGGTAPAFNYLAEIVTDGTHASEYVCVTALATNTVTITRGCLGTTGVAHNSGSVVNWYDLLQWGGVIELLTPTQGVGPMIANTPLRGTGMEGLTLRGNGGRIQIRAGNSFPGNSAVVDFSYCDRATIEDLVIDCNNVAQGGILHRRNQNFESASTMGGPASQNSIRNNRVINYTGTSSGQGAAYVIGVADENSATENCAFYGNTGRNAGSASVSGTLAADITNSQKTLTITSATGWPSPDATLGWWNGDFIIGLTTGGVTEYVLCQTRSGTTCTVKRGMMQTVAAPHAAATTTVTAYFGSHGLRNLIGDFQVSYCNWNNTAATYGSGIYTDAHISLYESHVAASANTSPADVYIRGGDHIVIGECYLDTIQSGCGVMIAPPSGGNSNQVIVRNNYFNMQNLGNDGTKQYCVIADSSDGNIRNLHIVGNEARGPTTAPVARALVNNITGSGTFDGEFVASNGVHGMTRLWDGGAPQFLGVNNVDDRTKKWQVGGLLLKTTTGAPSTTEGVDVLHLYAGTQVFNTNTNIQYIYNGTTFRSVAM